MSLFIEGKLFNKTGAESGGGGGGDQHNLGWYATPTALRTAHPTANDGDWAIVGSTDTVWVWDSDSSDWKDSMGTALVESVNGKAGVVVLDAHDVGAIPQLTTMPVAFTDNDGWVVQYVGPTNSSHTQGYFYRNKRTDLYTSTVTFQPATISGTVVACAGSSFAQFAKTAIGGDPRSIVSGTMTYDSAGNLWVFVGKNSSNVTIVTYQVYQEDYEDAGFTFTGTPSDGDVVAFTCDIVSAGAVYTWKQINVQPTPSGLPDQTGNAGKFLTTDGTDASWGNTLKTYFYLDHATLNKQTYMYYGGHQFVISASAEASNVDGKIEYKTNDQEWVIYTANNTCNYSLGKTALYAYGSNSGTVTLGVSTKKWANVYTTKINNGSDITVPAVAGEMAVKQVNTTITLAAADWSSNTQTASVTGMTATGVVLVSPDPTDQADYTSAGIYCSAQAAGTLTFTCSTTPTNDIDVVVVML